MQEVINLRPEDGAWRPVGPKEGLVMTTSDIRCIHTINDNFKVYIGTPSGSMWYWVYEDGILVATVNAGIATTNKEFVYAQLHKSLIISNVTDKTTTIFVFDITTERYTIFDSGFPELPNMVVTVQTPTLSYPFPVNEDGTGLSTKDEALAWVLAKIEKEAKYSFTGPVVLRFAWELVDGTIVKQSAPLYTSSSYLELLTADSIRWHGRWLQLTTTTSPTVLVDIATQWKGVIKNFNIYAMRPVAPVEGTSDILPLFKDPSLADDSDYYLIQSTPVDGGAFAILHYLIDDFREIETFPVMPADNFSHHTLFAASLFPYNERIFMGNVRVGIYDNFSPEIFLEPITGGVTGADYTVYFEVDLNTSDGKKTIRKGCTTINYYKSSSEPTVHAFKIRRYLAYPDARATVIRIIIDPVLSGTAKIVATLKLTPNNLLNFAYYNQPSATSPVTYGEYQFVGPITTYFDAVYATIADTYDDLNRIQATEQSNPFYYPAINSYRIGNGKILGMSTNAEALSQGQFGQFPIFCFTSDGIWTMNIGSGDPLISTIVSISREVCNNPASITQIDGGTAFTTERGLHIISGPTPVEISELAEGNHLSRLTGTVNYTAIANNPNLYQVQAYLCNIPLLSYFSGAHIGWDHIHKELVVSNPTKAYSWVFSLKAKVWFKVSETWERFIMDYPRTYGYRAIISEGGGDPILASSTDVSSSDDSILASEEYTGSTVNNYLCDLSQEDFSELVPVHMETRPMKLSATRYKKIHRMLIAGMVYDSLDNPFSVNLFGSPDDKSWYLLNSSNTFASRNRLLIGRTTFSCQYFILVIGGKVDEEAYFTHLEVDFEERYNNKLR